MYVKKTFIGCLVLIAVLALVVVSAGCVSQPQTSGDTEINVPDAAASISIVKNGSTYNFGDTMELMFMGIPAEYQLYVKEHTDGVSVEKNTVTVKQGGNDVSINRFTITALGNGNQTFSIAIRGKGSPSDSDTVIYKDSIDVADTGADFPIARTVYTVSLSNGLGFPAPGEYYDISIRGNATAGSKWVAEDTPGLVISDTVFIPDKAAEGETETEGTYHWYITSNKEGEYVFIANNVQPGKEEVEGRFYCPVVFVK